MTLAEVCEVVNGGTPRTGVAEYWDGPHQWITPAEMGNRASMYVEATERTLTDSGLDNSSARPLPAKSVILSSRAPIGHLVVNTVPMATNQGCKGLVPRGGLHYKFLYYYLLANCERLDAMGTGATFKELSGARLKEVRMPLPPLAEQRRIVGILDDAFAAIATARANAKRNLQNAGVLFASCLSDALTDRDGQRSYATLEEVVTKDCILSYGIVQPGHELEDGLPVVRPVDLTTRIIGGENLKRIDPAKASAYKRTTLKGGELLLCVRGSTGEMSVAAPELKGANVTRGIVPIRFEPTLLNPEFGYYLFRSESVQDQIRAGTYGAALMQINIRDLRRLALRFPPIAEQRRIVRTLAGAESECDRLSMCYQQKLVAVDALKKSLLHQAFSGQLASRACVREHLEA
ncbi:MAG TPA: restriction endonuclease subunit S [Tepidisphaeraceae bacterium]|nr:restriction endonuclease subunit S [Tepidisphaeraceae bacterium]